MSEVARELGSNISNDAPIEAHPKAKVAGFHHIYLFVITFVLGNLIVKWSKALENGFWEVMLATLLIGVAYLCLALCQAEMTSMLPFSGGTYGFARVGLGPFVGYLVGYMEVIAHFMFTVNVVETFGDAIQHMVGGSDHLLPVYWMVFYVPAGILLLAGSKYFYSSVAILGVLSLFLVVLYILAASPEMDFQRNVVDNDNSFFDGGSAAAAKSFSLMFPMIAELYLGIQSVTLVCEDTHDATTTVPTAFVSAIGLLFILSFVIPLSVCSHDPGVQELASSVAPMNYGYATAFQIPERSATVFSLFALFGDALAHIFCFSRILLALSQSRLCLKFLDHHSSSCSNNESPVLPIVVGLVLSYAILLIEWIGWKREVHIVVHACLVFTFCTYLIVFASFLSFKWQFSSIRRKFTNPMGYFTTGYGFVIFGICAVVVLSLEEEIQQSAIVVGSITIFLLLYYYFVASKTQTYSKEEQHLLLKLYVIKGNAKKRKKKRASSSSQSSANSPRSGSNKSHIRSSGNRSGNSKSGNNKFVGASRKARRVGPAPELPNFLSANSETQLDSSSGESDSSAERSGSNHCSLASSSNPSPLEGSIRSNRSQSISIRSQLNMSLAAKELLLQQEQEQEQEQIQETTTAAATSTTTSAVETLAAAAQSTNNVSEIGATGRDTSSKSASQKMSLSAKLLAAVGLRVSSKATNFCNGSAEHSVNSSHSGNNDGWSDNSSEEEERNVSVRHIAGSVKRLSLELLDPFLTPSAEMLRQHDSPGSSPDKLEREEEDGEEEEVVGEVGEQQAHDVDINNNNNNDDDDDNDRIQSALSVDDVDSDECDGIQSLVTAGGAGVLPVPVHMQHLTNASSSSFFTTLHEDRDGGKEEDIRVEEMVIAGGGSGGS